MRRLFVPGRLCLFGEHSDWAGALRAADPGIVPGACLLAGTDHPVAQPSGLNVISAAGQSALCTGA